jgi:hypothetical protein
MSVVNKDNFFKTIKSKNTVNQKFVEYMEAAAALEQAKEEHYQILENENIDYFVNVYIKHYKNDMITLLADQLSLDLMLAELCNFESKALAYIERFSCPDIFFNARERMHEFTKNFKMLNKAFEILKKVEELHHDHG